MKITILGTRGVPAAYGGFETFAEEIGKRLVKRGHEVTIFGRKSFGEKKPSINYQNIIVEYASTIMSKYLETPLSSLTSFLRVSKKKSDVILLCNAANSPFSFLARLKRIPLLINVDGIERKRSKWNAFGRLWYRLGEISSVLFADRVIADAVVISNYYKENYKIDTEVIAYGAEARKVSNSLDVISKWDLLDRGYILYVSRLEPENNALGVIKAYKKSGLKLPLVIVGNAPYAQNYKAQLKREACSGVIFTGFQFGDVYHALQSHALVYIQATEVGGTHPALIESMAHGNCIIANGTPENLEVLGDAGQFYSVNNFDNLTEILISTVNSEDIIVGYRKLAKDRAEKLYSWEHITDQYERLFHKVVQS